MSEVSRVEPASSLGARPGLRVVVNRAWRFSSKLLHSQRAWRWLSWLVLVPLVPCAVWLALDSGSTLDEPGHVRYGVAILNWFTSGFEDRAAMSTSYPYLYGGLFDFIGAFVADWGVIPLGIYDLLHVLTALIAVVGVVVTWKLAACVDGPRAGFFAAAYLTLTPVWVGHGWFNPKDTPFAVGAAYALYATARACLDPERVSWGSALRIGLGIGLALAVRPGGMFLFAYPLLVLGARYLIDSLARRRQQRPLLLVRRAAQSASRLFVAAIVAWALMISAWPWAQLDPLHRPMEAAEIAANYAWRNRVLFNGERILSYELPASYLPTWFGITLPDLYVVPLLCMPIALTLVLRRRDSSWPRALCVLLYIAAIVMPLAGVLVKRPIIYDAQRHFLFLLPPFAALCGITTSHVLRETRIAAWLRMPVLASLIVLGGLSFYDMWRLHPFEYVYFNRMFGGLPAAEGRFETDYWGAANREAYTWVVRHVPPRDDGKPVRVGMCYADWQIDYYGEALDVSRKKFRRSSESSAQIYIATTRDGCHKKRGNVIHKVERQGVPLVYVLER